MVEHLARPDWHLDAFEYDDRVASYWRASLDITIEDLLPARTLHLTRIDVMPMDLYDVVRLYYDMFPPIESNWGIPAGAYQSWAVKNEWELTGVDDLGNEYVDRGGVRGSLRDSDRTSGERDLFPAPPKVAAWLDTTLHAGLIVLVPDGVQWSMRMALPV